MCGGCAAVWRLARTARSGWAAWHPRAYYGQAMRDGACCSWEREPGADDECKQGSPAERVRRTPGVERGSPECSQVDVATLPDSVAAALGMRPGQGEPHRCASTNGPSDRCRSSSGHTAALAGYVQSANRSRWRMAASLPLDKSLRRRDAIHLSIDRGADERASLWTTIRRGRNGR